MKDWKLNQLLYHASVESHTDDEKNFENIVSDEIVDNAVAYFHEKRNESIYPAKSYAIAILYAFLLTVHFDEDFFEVLDDPELLFNNDPCFVPYSKDKETYDAILAKLGPLNELDLQKGWIPWTVNYFMMECVGDDDRNSLGDTIPTIEC